MKIAVSLLVVFLNASLVAADPSEHKSILSAEELHTFSQSALGGIVENFIYDGKEIAVVMRSFTSGVRSSDLSVYAKHDGGYIRVLYREPIWMSHLKAAQDGDTITILMEPTKQILLTFTISGCYFLQDMQQK